MSVEPVLGDLIFFLVDFWSCLFKIWIFVACFKDFVAFLIKDELSLIVNVYFVI